jgi:uncharacterized protein (TIGR03083 family)
MEYAEHLDAAHQDLDAICTAVAAGPLDSRVPTCPEFDVDDLARHVAAFCLRWTQVVRARREVPFATLDRDDPLPGPPQRAEWLAAIGHELVELLRATPPDTECWSWYPPDQSAGFIARRVANELCMHRVDAQLARGEAGPIDAALAADGIDEIFFILEHHARFRHDPSVGTGRTMHLHGTDAPADGPPAEWMVTLAPDGVRVTREHAKGDLAVRGAVGDLERLLYQRPTAEPVQVFGDETVLTELYELFTF